MKEVVGTERDPRERAAAIIQQYLDREGIRHQRSGEWEWLVEMEGEVRRSVTALIVLGERTVLVESFFMRRPPQNEAEFYRYLLAKNLGFYLYRFAVDELGDVYLLAQVPIACLDEDELDRLLGTLLTYSDGSFNPALRIAYASELMGDGEGRGD